MTLTPTAIHPIIPHHPPHPTPPPAAQMTLNPHIHLPRPQPPQPPHSHPPHSHPHPHPLQSLTSYPQQQISSKPAVRRGRPRLSESMRSNT